MWRIVSTTLICICFSASLRAQQTPTHVCPQFSYGQTGEIHHWYSVFIEVDGENCTELYWETYDGGPNEPEGGSCMVQGKCKPLTFLASKAARKASQAVINSGLSELPDPSHEPQLSPAASVIDSRIVDVMITPTKVIKVKLRILLIDPRVIGKPLKPIIVAQGFEVRYDPTYPPKLVVPNSDVRGSHNHYEMTIGSIAYQVITHEEP